jgi:DNA polymerase I-like protein with 3'-5' exonuclease and polymerase domains
LLFEVRDDMIEPVIALVRPLMENAYPLAVPLTVHVAVGKDWGHLVPYTHA